MSNLTRTRTSRNGVSTTRALAIDPSGNVVLLPAGAKIKRGWRLLTAEEEAARRKELP